MPSYRALSAEQHTQELHTTSIPPSLPLFVLGSKPQEEVAGLGLGENQGH